MTRKKYVSPTMEICKFSIQHQLLFGSKINDIKADGLYDESIEQEDLKDETPESIWEEAW